MRAAQAFQSKLEGKVGTTTQARMVFEPTETLVVDKGGEITSEHLIVVQEVATERLSEYQATMEQERQVEIASETAKRDEVLTEVEAAIAQQQEHLQGQIGVLRAEVADRRNEIMALRQMEFLGEARYRELKNKYGQIFKADMGAEAFYEILGNMELEKLAKELWIEVRETRSKQRRKKATKRLRVVEALRSSSNQPQWMILTMLPVIPADLRPMVQLDGGRFATSDLNDLYRRVINRNNRLKRLLELGAPDVIVRNEKRMLQEAVDSLIDNSQRGKALSRRGRRELKSLSDMLKGKKGRFRRNLLGKRVDYSGRSVIVIGPLLKLSQCGLPKTMALELYRPFVISKLVQYNYASNVKGAKRIIEREKPEVWEVLEEVITQRPVLLNRAPTLHRLGIQAFEPVLVEGKAIQIHPLVCTAFNADFDGDQMAVHVPLSQKAVDEARSLMLSTRNLLKPADGAPIVGPSKDMVLGVYYLTMDPVPPVEDENEVRVFVDMDEVEMAYTLGQVHLHTAIRIQRIYDDPEAPPLDEPLLTTVGRCVFNRILPDELRWVNHVLDKREVNNLVAQCYTALGPDATTEVVDQIKNMGFLYATRSGTTIAISDLVVPDERQTIIDRTTSEVNEAERDYRRGLLTDQERYERTINLWNQAKDEVSGALNQALDPYGSISIMAKSGATKGGLGPITQLAGMRGLMADPSGRIIDLPIRSNFRMGLNALQYFISTHGARKGLADTALRTADAGYLTRRLVDVAQDMIVNADDCGPDGGIWISRDQDVAGQDLSERIRGRVTAGPVAHPETGEIVVERGQHLTDALADYVDEISVHEVFIRSPMTCELDQGICGMCYGRDLGRGEMVEIGSAVGIVAAQSIGEPGTQLTLRTFHTGGIAEARGDITHGLPRVEELFEARKAPKGEAVMSDIDGTVQVYTREGIRYVNVLDVEVMRDEYDIPGNWGVDVEDGDEVEAGQRLAFRGEQEVLASSAGRVVRDGTLVTVVYERRDEREYEIPSAARIRVGDGDHVVAGQQLTEGSKNPHRILRILGREATELYLMSEVQEVYRSQGVNINDKHFEVIIYKMLSKVQITLSGDTNMLPGELVDGLELRRINDQMLAEGGQPAAAQSVLLGITKCALNTDSFLSASSFQHTIKVLAGAAIEGKSDPLFGLKENVIIGKLIPAGTGFQHYHGGDDAEALAAAEGADGDMVPELAEDVTLDAAQPVGD
jgi:DNA-directed RNA polymerase subunit beta'